MFSIRGKLIIYALEIVAASLLVFTIPPWEWDRWIHASLAGIAVFALGLAVAMGRSIATTVERLVRATIRIGEGNYDEPVPVRGSDELGRLGREIERMRMQLRERLRLLEEFGRDLEHKVEERTAELAAARDRIALIHQITNTVNSSLDFPQVFEAVVGGTRRLVDFDQATVARIVDPDTAVVFARAGGAPGDAPGRKIPLRGSRLEGVVVSRKPAVFDRPPGSDAEDTLLLSSVAREAVIPLIVGGEAIGTFNLGSRRPDAFGSHELEVLEQIASVLGVALLRAEAYERQRQAAQELRALSELKSEFVSNVSHDLRTPLTSILGAADNLLDGIAGPIGEKVRDYLRRIQENAKRLLSLIDDLLDLSRIEAGEERVVPARWPLQALVEETLDTVRPLAARAGVELHLEPSAELVLWADRDKLRRVLLNLLQNGIKFTAAGGAVSVSWSAKGDGFVDISVTDTGVGIAPEELERIFDRFHRARVPGRGTLPGSGLGLAISRKLVRLHGGELSVSSAPGRGSTFRIRLPLEPSGARCEATGATGDGTDPGR
jgi:signal transduction histidine kinase/HAMP domain-containing protein